MPEFAQISNKDLILRLREALSKASIAADVAWMEAYMKNRFRFFGVKSKARRDVAREVFANFGLPPKMHWQDFCRQCWESDERELQYIAMELAGRYKSAWKTDDIHFFEHLIINKSWWDTVDHIASNLAGPYFRNFPEQIEKVIPKWIRSDNMWVNRTAILFQLKYKTETDFDLLKEAIEPHRNSPEFFHQKAIGWALREYAKSNPSAVIEYVDSTDLKPLSRREALKHLRA